MSFALALISLLLTAGAVAGQNAPTQRLADELLNSKEMGIRRRAAEGLGRAGTPQAIRLLTEARRTEAQVSIRLAIVRAMRTIAFQRYPGYRVALKAIDEASDDDSEEDELVRLRATEALWEAGKRDLLDPVPILERQLSDRSERLRLAAVKMLRKHGRPAVADVLGRAAQDKTLSESVRLEAIEALGAVALSEGGVVGREVDGANTASLQRLGIAPLVSAKAMDRRHERQVGYLAAVVDDPDNSTTLVLRAVKSIGQVKDKSAIPVLARLIESHPHAGIRRQAIRALSHVMARQYE